MASEVDISNIALAHLGDAANIQSISPPDGSAQAEHCQRFLSVARDSLMEMHDWGFATRRVALALLSTNPASGWAYCYAQPADLLNSISVLDPAAQDDTSVGLNTYSSWIETPQPVGGVYTPQPYSLESATDGTDILLTNQAGAVLRYVARVTDPNKFSPLFVDCLTWSLAAMLAGPVMKGKEGASMGASCRMIAFGRDGKSGLFGQAVASDSGQKRATTRDRHQVSWINGR